MKKIFVLMLVVLLFSVAALASQVMAAKGAWCWFADPRALHYENDGGSINATYVGYIDVHGNVKATQYDWLTGRKTDVLVRSFFQPDDHNNPTFLVLPDERVMIFYTRHTDEPCIWYRISLRPGDITELGEEKRMATESNTTYPSPFILSDDPGHIYLCWRGMGWHPTIARLTMPDADGNCTMDYGPRQMVQSTGARPYAKYYSNGKDRIYMAYTTGHPDNELPNWLYLNVIDIDHGHGPVLRDAGGRLLSVVNEGVFHVDKTDDYANAYPATVVDRSPGVRNWVWQTALDTEDSMLTEELPVVAYTHIDDAKTSHDYWYARWDGASWQTTRVAEAGHAFHQNWDKTERCYSGGMAIDPDDTRQLYLSVPTTDGAFDRDGTYEIWHYTIDWTGDAKDLERHGENGGNNMRPYVIQGSGKSKMRLLWMHGDYYYWMVNKWYPQGFPTSIASDYDWQGIAWPENCEEATLKNDNIDLTPGKSVSLTIEPDTAMYAGPLFTITIHPTPLSSPSPGLKRLTYAINPDDQRPEITCGTTTYRSQNRLLTSDNWATGSSGTNGDSHPTKITTLRLTLTYDGNRLTVLRNGYVDQTLKIE